MTVGRMLREMTALEMVEWQAHYFLEREDESLRQGQGGEQGRRTMGR